MASSEENTTLVRNHLVGKNLLNRSKSTYFDTDQLKNKTIGLLFAAYWCCQCRSFTKTLIEAYNDALAKNEHLPFDIIFISSDDDEDDFNKFYQQMPWKAIPFEDSERSEMLLAHYHIENIPSLLILKPTGEVLTSKGDGEFTLMKTIIDLWIQDKTLFWTREQSNEKENIWMNVTCHLCYMKPLVGERFGCIDRECGYDLCQRCYEQISFEHTHEIMHFLSPKQNYSMEELFPEKNLINKNHEDITLRSIEGKYVGLLFSALWSMSNEDLISNLKDVYANIIETSLPFEIVFISADDNQIKFDQLFQLMPWKALPFDNVTTTIRLKTYFSVRDIPTLIVLKPTGQLLTRSGRRDIDKKGIEAVRIWCRGDTIQYSSDSFIWTSLICDGCNMTPLIGQRFYCATCTNYDLCAACQEKGHEHELTLIEPPNEVD